MEKGKSLLQKTQDEVEEVRVIMMENKKKAEERAENLEELQERAEELQQKARGFEELSAKLKDRHGKEHKNLNVKAFVAVAAVLVTVVLIIVLLATGVISTSSPLYPTVTPTSEP